MKNKKVFISVVSHGHGDMIQTLGCLQELAKKYSVIVKNNINDVVLIKYLIENNIYYIDELYGLGFGANNNLNYHFCKKKLGMNSNDIFIVLNPDVIVDTASIAEVINAFIKNNCKVLTINLYRDIDYTVFDNSVRNIPKITDFLISFLGLNNGNKIDKHKIKENTFVGWCAGSFMAFDSLHYQSLNGFDERYFMYCEDIDICYRSSRLGHEVLYLPNVKAIHLAKHKNRDLFSKHFFWHVKSMIIFLLKTKIKIETISRLNK